LKEETKTVEVEHDVSLTSFQDSTCASGGQIASVMFPELVPIPTRFDARIETIQLRIFALPSSDQKSRALSLMYPTLCLKLCKRYEYE
jgi:hypothetical protein